jgi:transposase-like protein
MVVLGEGGERRASATPGAARATLLFHFPLVAGRRHAQDVEESLAALSMRVTDPGCGADDEEGAKTAVEGVSGGGAGNSNPEKARGAYAAFTEEEKQEAVNLMLVHRLTVAEVCRRMSSSGRKLSHSTCAGWKKKVARARSKAIQKAPTGTAVVLPEFRAVLKDKRSTHSGLRLPDRLLCTLHMWFQNARANNRAVSREDIKRQALILAQKICPEVLRREETDGTVKGWFAASDSFASSWTSRYNLGRRAGTKCTTKVPDGWTEQDLKELFLQRLAFAVHTHKVLHDDLIVFADETQLMYTGDEKHTLEVRGSKRVAIHALGDRRGFTVMLAGTPGTCAFQPRCVLMSDARCSQRRPPSVLDLQELRQGRDETAEPHVRVAALRGEARRVVEHGAGVDDRQRVQAVDLQGPGPVLQGQAGDAQRRPNGG